MLRLGTQGLAGAACLTGSLYIGATGSHVPYGSQDHGHAPFMPDAGWAIIGHPPTLSQERDPLLVSTSPGNLSTRHQGFAHARLRDPHLTGITGLFPQRSRQRLLTDAAWGGLKPAPESRLRRACPSSSIQLRKPFGLAFVTHGLPGSDTILDGSNWSQTPVERRSLAERSRTCCLRRFAAPRPPRYRVFRSSIQSSSSRCVRFTTIVTDDPATLATGRALPPLMSAFKS